MTAPPATLCHTTDLDAAARRAIRDLLALVFADDLTDDDRDHALGGLHAVALDDGRPDDALTCDWRDGDGW